MQTVSILPHELGSDVRETALKKLRDILTARKNVVEVLDIQFLSTGMVVPSKGNVNYKLRVKLKSFIPKEGMIVECRITDVLADSVLLRIAHVICFLHTLVMKRHNITVDHLRKRIIVKGTVYTINSPITVVLHKLRNDGNQTKAIVDMP